MKQINKLWPFIAPVIGGLFNILDLLLPDSMIQNQEVRETLSHLFWLGNVCWYLGIPITVIYLIIKVNTLQKQSDETTEDITKTIKGHDEWATKEIRRLNDELGKCVKTFTLGQK